MLLLFCVLHILFTPVLQLLSLTICYLLPSNQKDLGLLLTLV